MPYSGSFSEQIEEISSAFPAVLDCATCRTPQPMKIDLLPSAHTAMEISSSIGAPHAERSAIAKHDGPGEKGSDRPRANSPALLPMSLNLRLVVQHCAQQRSMHLDLSVVADETQLAELVHEKTDP